jgi:hypothetical protein
MAFGGVAMWLVYRRRFPGNPSGSGSFSKRDKELKYEVRGVTQVAPPGPIIR